MLEQTTPQLAPKERCTGCGACANGCPRGAIHMLPDREGFLYPTVTDACIQCGHCSHICPVRKQREPRPEPAVFAAWNTDEAVRRASTAGGVFSTLADYILESGGVVFGAATDEQLHVRHIAVHSAEELPRLRGTKPVQSEIGDCYQKVRYYLDRGRRVLFSGTPCQVDGLYRYLGEHPENLLTCDVLCSGAASPGVWAHLLQTMAYIKQHEPLSVQFFGKLPGERERRFHVAFQGGVYDAPIGRSDFGRGLLRGLFLRPACHACPYVTADRPGRPDARVVSRPAEGFLSRGAEARRVSAAGELSQRRPCVRHAPAQARAAHAGRGRRRQPRPAQRDMYPRRAQRLL